MKLLSLTMLILLSACNPELGNVGSSPYDLVKYFKVTGTNNGIGDGILIVAHIGEKRLLTFYLKNASGKYAHSDIMIISGTNANYEVESVYSLTPDCQLAPDKQQPQYFEQLQINGEVKSYNRKILTREEAMAEEKALGC